MHDKRKSRDDVTGWTDYVNKHYYVAVKQTIWRF